MSSRFSKKDYSSANQVIPPLRECLAKRSEDGSHGMTVEDHCRLVGWVAERLVARLPEPTRKLIPDGAVTLAAAHDVGKVSPGFQARILGTNQCGYEESHAVISEAAVRKFYQANGMGHQGWAVIAGLHHGDRSEPLADTVGKYGGPGWSELRQSLIDKLIKDFGQLPNESPSAVFTFLAGLVCIADWIASDENLFPLGCPIGDYRNQIDKILDNLGFLWPTPQQNLTFEQLFRFPPNSIQTATYNLADDRALLVVEGPMGCGKTEAALWAAYRLMTSGRNQGLYFALPTRLSSNLVYHRVVAFLRTVFGASMATRLLHGQAWLYEFLQQSSEDQPGMLAGGEEFVPGRSWFSPAKRGLLWPFAVGTVDQALLGTIQVRHYFLRLFGLAGKVVILDEVHSYDVYTGTLIDALIEKLLNLGCSVILLSGTLTRSRRQELGVCIEGSAANTYPLISRIDGKTCTPECPDRVKKGVHLKKVNPQNETFWSDLESYLKKGAVVLWVCNAVATAQAYSCEAQSRLSFVDVDILHSRFLPWHRSEKEEKWSKQLGKDCSKRDPGLFIATQVVEQSVDLDADLLITELAPTDMLLQRMGRLWRHPRDRRPLAKAECWLIDGDCHTAQSGKEFCDRLGRSAHVYAPYVLWRTAELFVDRADLQFPEDVRSLLEATYCDPQSDDPEWVSDLYHEMEKHKKKLRNIALTFQSSYVPVLEDEVSALTRYSSFPTEDLLIIKRESRHEHGYKICLLDRQEPVIWQPPKRNLTVAARLHSNLVTIPSYFVKNISSQQPREWVEKHLARNTIVVCWKEDGSLETLDGQSTRLRYSLEWGLHCEDEKEVVSDGNNILAWC